ncbi:tetratricopeptide repeat protein [Plebeiibacterium marinum]|uniref:Tetratricopeptide repeat protein n=1 Tax=Plebeiibacterium marinum TaxID=2992111 RepID=A0AAE3SJ57_9BACT|nr:tetratricopeptide repeat protein [Plebeiobacterium marinum]MCW3804010.1 tetratricopeptide repeat protein [Plebeiobacterium marinum]
MRRLFDTKILLLLLLIILSACSGKKKVSLALKSYEIGEYTRAAELFKRAYSGEKNKYIKGEYSYYMGECYRITNKPTKAASAYSKAIRYKYPERQARFYMAESYRKAGKLEKAIPEYETYLEEVPADVRAQKGLASCMMLQKQPKEGRYQIEKIKRLNSKFSDFSPAFVGDSYDYVVFSSMRTESKKKRKNRITGQGVSSLYFSKIDAKDEWSEPEAFEDPINLPQVDDGAPNVSSDGKELYYTRCKYDNTKPMGAEIVVCSRSGGRWGEPVAIQIGLDSLVVAHPAISPDGNTLYFVSDREGGYGGKDIWKTNKSGEGWGEPENLGSAINTPGDEMFPYVREDGSLYFSSDTHVGFGGQDIFKGEIDEEGLWQVTNMGAPINSESDDFGIAFKGKSEEGIFSSSRGSAKGVDNLYSFILPKLKFELSGSIMNNNEEVVLGAYLRLIGSDGTTLKINAPADGTFKVKLKPDTDYVFLVAAEGYLNQKVKFSTSGEIDDKDFEYDIVLEKPMQKISDQ